ncbi:MAG: RNA polymerase factor sigma-54 [Candidatus Korobacteraceae bacterium]|jgi:RNA polymerase sigma-54 factor
MVSLQPKLNLKISQRQILTPGLVQMVSVLALNKLELKDMINAEIIENPVLDEYMDAVPSLDEVAGREEQRERDSAAPTEEQKPKEEHDPFDEIDFGSFFQDYLDPGYRSSAEFESVEKPSFENFLSKPTSLTDHLMWQLGSVHLKDDVLAAAELVIGNLNEDGYLLASDEELLALADPWVSAHEDHAQNNGQGELGKAAAEAKAFHAVAAEAGSAQEADHSPAPFAAGAVAELPPGDGPKLLKRPDAPSHALFGIDALHEAIHLVRHFDPVGVAARDVRECLLAQLEDLRNQYDERGSDPQEAEALEDALVIVDRHLHQLQNKQYKEIAKALGRSVEAVMLAFALIRTLDPKPGLRYNKSEPRLIEPDVAFVKQGDEYMIVMNDDDMPQLRLNPRYRKLLRRDGAEKEVRNYVKERYKSAIQLIKNIEQRRQTILKVCEAVIGRQRDFLDRGIDMLKPMMIKEVAEEIGVHPSTVSRAVANKYVHTSQGVFELRYFFSESVNGPQGGGTSLLILKRRVKKLIEEEDPARPLTDEQITRILQSQGIQVTRRTVAKYREDMKIPSTHQRRVKH